MRLNFYIFRHYVLICSRMNIIPNFDGLMHFKKFHDWERKNYG
ncbi:conserved hypothetical protein [Clostridium neonatale]|nr:conserved hypothetical protein [Clostridium neonatale]CAI3702597.1 conserved hypothetical protein [Clostridium neonatale]